MKITVIGTGYVGLVTGVTLADIGHEVTCVDINEAKIKLLNNSISPIYEPGIEELIKKNIEEKRLQFTSNLATAVQISEVVYIAVGTPQNEDGSANLSFIKEASKKVAHSLIKDSVVVVKSTVPIGTNRKLEKMINQLSNYNVSIVSNPEFLREGSAIEDVYSGDRIVIGSDDKNALEIIVKINKEFNVPILKTELESAEMIKYASNAFLATKISFINEIANLCEKTGASIREVSKGMGMDTRIGSAFLQAGIGYGGSCFPKDTAALTQIAGTYSQDFHLLKSVIEVNQKQQLKLVEKLLTIYPSIEDRKIAVLGLAFKPETDDIRDAASTQIIKALLKQKADVYAYDPIACENSQKLFGDTVKYYDQIADVLDNAEAVLIITEWNSIKKITAKQFKKSMKNPIVLDGRLLFDQEEMKNESVSYYSIGEGRSYV